VTPGEMTTVIRSEKETRLQPQVGCQAVDGTAASVQSHQAGEITAHVAMLAATALGFAYAPTADIAAHARRLATLAGPSP
jgi:hypothetical protein